MKNNKKLLIGEMVVNSLVISFFFGMSIYHAYKGQTIDVRIDLLWIAILTIFMRIPVLDRQASLQASMTGIILDMLKDLVEKGKK